MSPSAVYRERGHSDQGGEGTIQRDDSLLPRLLAAASLYPGTPQSRYGIPHEDICRLVINPRTGRPIDDKTLRRHFRYELDTGYVKANAKVAQSLYAQATGGNVTAAIWWTKARMGWAERVEHSGKGGGPIDLRTLLLEIDGTTRGLPHSKQLSESLDRPRIDLTGRSSDRS
jgi:hypothetical protein